MSETLLAVIIGGVLTTTASLVLETVRRRWESRHDTDRRADDRRIAFDVFQREAMLALQDSAAEVVLAAVAIHDLREQREKAGQAWAAEPLSIDLFERDRTARFALSTQMSRVADDQLRRLADSLNMQSNDLRRAKDRYTSGGLAIELVLTLDKVTKRSGVLIRASFTSSLSGMRSVEQPQPQGLAEGITLRSPDSGEELPKVNHADQA